MAQRVWIDVTDFLKWQGTFTAFQHIQYHMARLYLASQHDVGFFVYDQATRTFREVAFDPDSVSTNGLRTESVKQSGSRAGLIHVIKRLTPKPVKQTIKKLLARGPTSPALAANSHSPFRRGEVVVVLGGIWHGTFAADMAREKQKQGFKFVHVVHDMIPVVCPQCVVEDLPETFATYKETIFKIADGLLINSESSKRDALAFMKQRGISPPASRVFRLADEPLVGAKPEPVKGLQPGKFLLSLGTVEGRKNHLLLYYAYKQAAREGIKLPKMVIAGRHGWLISDFLYLVSRDSEIKDQFVLLEGVSNTERAWLFENCLFSVWTSFYEGWGMPIAESLTYGKLCVSTDTSSMPEVGGDLVDYFSPFSPEDCLRLMQKYLDGETRLAKEKQIEHQYKVTTWQDMYQVVSDFVDKVQAEDRR